MHTPPLSCNVTPTFPALVLLFFVHAAYNTPLSSRSLHRLLWVTYLFVHECAGFSPTFLPCWCFFSKTTTGAAKFCCSFGLWLLTKTPLSLGSLHTCRFSVFLPQTVCPYWRVLMVGVKAGAWAGCSMWLSILSPNSVSTLKGSCGRGQGRCLSRVLHLAVGIFPINSRINWLLWPVHVRFDCAGSHRVCRASLSVTVP